MPSKLTKHAKTLRKNATHAENKLWYGLRARQIEGLKFRRQQPIENTDEVLEYIRRICNE